MTPFISSSGVHEFNEMKALELQGWDLKIFLLNEILTPQKKINKAKNIAESINQSIFGIIFPWSNIFLQTMQYK